MLILVFSSKPLDFPAHMSYRCTSEMNPSPRRLYLHQSLLQGSSSTLAYPRYLPFFASPNCYVSTANVAQYGRRPQLFLSYKMYPLAFAMAHNIVFKCIVIIMPSSPGTCDGHLSALYWRSSVRCSTFAIISRCLLSDHQYLSVHLYCPNRWLTLGQGHRQTDMSLHGRNNSKQEYG